MDLLVGSLSQSSYSELSINAICTDPKYLLISDSDISAKGESCGYQIEANILSTSNFFKSRIYHRVS